MNQIQFLKLSMIFDMDEYVPIADDINPMMIIKVQTITCQTKKKKERDFFFLRNQVQMRIDLKILNYTRNLVSEHGCVQLYLKMCYFCPQDAQETNTWKYEGLPKTQ